MRAAKLLLTSLTVIPAIVLAQATETRCTNGDLVRRVAIMSEPGVSVPCEVHYFKDTEAPGEDQVLWSASSQAGYCEERASEFVAKLEEWGWNCGAGEAPATPAAEPPSPAEAPEEPADMTEDLAPAAPAESSDG